MNQGGQERDQLDAAVVPFVRRQRRAAQLHALAYNLGNFLRTLATPEPIKDWSLTSLKEKLIKIGAKVVSHGRYVAFQMAEVAVPRQMFQEILRLIAELRPQPPPAPASDVRWSASAIDRRNASRCHVNGQISPSNTVRAAQADGSLPNLASVLWQGRKSTNIHASFGSHLGHLVSNLSRRED